MNIDDALRDFRMTVPGPSGGLADRIVDAAMQSGPSSRLRRRGTVVAVVAAAVAASLIIAVSLGRDPRRRDGAGPGRVGTTRLASIDRELTPEDVMGPVALPASVAATGIDLDTARQVWTDHRNLRVLLVVNRDRSDFCLLVKRLSEGGTEGFCGPTGRIDGGDLVVRTSPVTGLVVGIVPDGVSAALVEGRRLTVHDNVYVGDWTRSDAPTEVTLQRTGKPDVSVPVAAGHPLVTFTDEPPADGSLIRGRALGRVMPVIHEDGRVDVSPSTQRAIAERSARVATCLERTGVKVTRSRGGFSAGALTPRARRECAVVLRASNEAALRNSTNDAGLAVREAQRRLRICLLDPLGPTDRTRYAPRPVVLLVPALPNGAECVVRVRLELVRLAGS